MIGRHRAFEEGKQIGDLVREMLDAERPWPMLQRERGQLVPAGSAADAAAAYLEGIGALGTGNTTITATSPADVNDNAVLSVK